MNNHDTLSKTTVLILCGGKGTRLQHILKGSPKILAPIHNRVFLDIPLTDLMYKGFKDIVLCTGYLKNQVREYVNKNKNRIPYKKLDISFSEEDELLGTGGAIKNASFSNLIKSDNFIVLNGDTICNVDFNELYKYHVKHNKLLTILLSEKQTEYGSVILLKKTDKDELLSNNKGTIVSFNEKSNYLTNTGVYIFKKRMIDRLPIQQSFSLENELIPQLIKINECNGLVTDNDFIDIGIPERYSIYKEMTCPK